MSVHTDNVVVDRNKLIKILEGVKYYQNELKKKEIQLNVSKRLFDSIVGTSFERLMLSRKLNKKLKETIEINKIKNIEHEILETDLVKIKKLNKYLKKNLITIKAKKLYERQKFRRYYGLLYRRNNELKKQIRECYYDNFELFMELNYMHYKLNKMEENKKEMKYREIIKYLLKNINYQSETNDKCSICLCEFNDETINLPCGHYLHFDCFDKLQNNSCPLCRKDINFDI